MRREATAFWVSLLLSAQTGTEVTPAQLLGTEEEEKQTKLEDAQRDLKSLERRMSKAGLATRAPRSKRKAKSHG